MSQLLDVARGTYSRKCEKNMQHPISSLDPKFEDTGKEWRGVLVILHGVVGWGRRGGWGLLYIQVIQLPILAIPLELQFVHILMVFLDSRCLSILISREWYELTARQRY